MQLSPSMKVKIIFKYAYEAKYIQVSDGDLRIQDLHVYFHFFQEPIQYGMDLLILFSRHLIKVHLNQLLMMYQQQQKLWRGKRNYLNHQMKAKVNVDILKGLNILRISTTNVIMVLYTICSGTCTSIHSQEFMGALVP